VELVQALGLAEPLLKPETALLGPLLEPNSKVEDPKRVFDQHRPFSCPAMAGDLFSGQVQGEAQVHGCRLSGSVNGLLVHQAIDAFNAAKPARLDKLGQALVASGN
jgi:hypothetical protein